MTVPLRATAAAVDAAGWGPLVHVAETGSTNADLVAAARAGDTSPRVLIADHQTAGRGRLDRRWVDEPGRSLLMSVRLPAASPDVAVAASAAVALAARAAAASLCPDATLLVKWPNDIVTDDGRKLGGVLAEYVDTAGGCVVVGVGINVAALGVARSRIDPGGVTPASLVELGGSGTVAELRDRLAAATVSGLAARVAEVTTGICPVDELERHSATVGRRVRVELPGGRVVVGRAVGLDRDGALLCVGDDGGRHRVAVGDVVHLRPVDRGADPDAAG
ncbi:MAG: biotin--[acetyl-CoA-carboxylase] ligase [Actinomyces sp.]|nr:MAG: biotin--[acetyl-CoA-carboxylase] ligase [Actinomyces sp.]